MIRFRSRTQAFVLSAVFTALMVVGAYLKIPIPLLPVTLQLPFAVLAGLMLGPLYGSLSMTAYMALGLAGLPVFTAGGGLAYVLKPSFGYIVGFVAAAALAGVIAERGGSRPSAARLFAAGFSGMMAVYAVGVPYFYAISALYLGGDVAARTLLVSCFLIFLPGNALTVTLGALLARRLAPAVGR